MFCVTTYSFRCCLQALPGQTTPEGVPAFKLVLVGDGGTGNLRAFICLASLRCLKAAISGTSGMTGRSSLLALLARAYDQHHMFEDF